MIKANEVFAKVLAACGSPQHRLAVVILKYFGFRSFEGEARDALLAIQDVAAECDMFYDEIVEAIGYRAENVEEVLIGALVTDTPWADWLASDVQEMPVHSNCGADCFSLILRSDRMLGDMADVPDEMHSAIYEAVARQCEVFVLG